MRTVFQNCTLLDGTEQMSPRPGTDVAIENDRIAQIGKITPNKGDRVVDLTGKYLMPGLINLHVHLPAGGKPQNKPMNTNRLTKIALSSGLSRALVLRMCHAYAMQGLLSGVTTVRAVGGLDNLDTRLRDRIHAGKLDGPRILAANYAIGVPHGHMVGSVTHPAETVEDAVRMVDQLHGQNVDLIKLMITGGVMDAKVKGEPGRLMMQADMIKACCDRAHSYGLKVAAHVQSPEGVRTAVLNGVDSIEHGAKPDADILRLFRERGAFQISTISPAVPYALFDRSISHATYEQQENGRVVFEGIVALAKACLENGIPVGLGTDTGCPYITHYDMWRELCYFVKYCGVTPAFALYSATLLNAELAGIADVTGSVEAGKAADLIVCDKDPLADLTALRSLHMVIRDGLRIEHPSVKKMPEVERELDKFL